jgi:hypothetical protein
MMLPPADPPPDPLPDPAPGPVRGADQAMAWHSSWPGPLVSTDILSPLL